MRIPLHINTHFEESQPPAYSPSDPLSPSPTVRLRDAFSNSSPLVISLKPWNENHVSYMSDQLSVDDFKLVCAQLSRNSTVSCLVLAKNSAAITDETVPILVKNLYANHTLKSINLASCSISTKGALFLGLYLQTNPCLEILMIQDNSILEDGCLAFLRGLSNQSLLQTSRNALPLGRSSSEDTLGPMTQNYTLKALNLSSNAILDSGFDAIVKCCVNHLVNLRNLHLENNGLVDTGIEGLISLCVHHPALQSIHIRANQFTPQTLTSLDKCLSYARHITLVDLRSSPALATVKTASITHSEKLVWKYKHDGLCTRLSRGVLGL